MMTYGFKKENGKLIYKPLPKELFKKKAKTKRTKKQK